MRLLNPQKAAATSIENLGLAPKLLKVIKKEIGKPHGMVLATGPTGSGKTTALYAFLKHVKKPEIKIITIEDPIEYHMDGIVQTQVDKKKKYSFAGGLRASLRQDPDVILVGEIRDSETAEVAIHAALTGHLVLSTLHTNNAAGTFPRLIDLGVNANIIGSSLNVSTAQRLVRKLCPSCKKETVLSGENKKLVDNILESFFDKNNTVGVQREKIWLAEGCDDCGGMGYKGRVGVFEAIKIDSAIENIVRQYPSEKDIWEVAKKQGIPTMRQDGILKVLSGITSLEELGRVINLNEELETKVPEESDSSASDTTE